MLDLRARPVAAIHGFSHSSLSSNPSACELTKEFTHNQYNSSDLAGSNPSYDLTAAGLEHGLQTDKLKVMIIHRAEARAAWQDWFVKPQILSRFVRVVQLSTDGRAIARNILVIHPNCESRRHRTNFKYSRAREIVAKPQDFHFITISDPLGVGRLLSSSLFHSN